MARMRPGLWPSRFCTSIIRGVSELRLALPLVFICLLCSSVAPSQPLPDANISSQPTALLARMWIWGDSTFTEYRYLVDLTKRQVKPEVIQNSDWIKLRAEAKRSDAEAYDRIVERFRDKARPDRGSDLAAALDWIAQSISWGYSTADAILASPDGAYALIAIRERPLLLINVATLDTRRLADNTGSLGTPAAWSPDSRLIAFAPPETEKLYVYDMERQAVTSTTTGMGPWIQALFWSPDAQRIAAFGLHNRRMNKTPVGLLAALAGHPEFRNDVVLHVHRIVGDEGFSLELKRGVS